MTHEEAKRILKIYLQSISFQYPGSIAEAIKTLCEPLPFPSDLDEAAEKYAIQGHENHTNVNYINTYIEGKRVGFIAGAEYQRKQDQSLIELAEEHAMLAGMNKMEQQMLEKAVEIEVKADAGGYPYIDKTFELYDYTEEKNIFNPGDIVIVNIRKKEDKK